MAGSSVITLPSAKVRSSVRCGREVWPPLPVSADVERVGGAGERALAQADRADVEARVAVQAEDARRRRRARRRAISCSAPPGMTSSAGWNSSRHAAGSSPRGVRPRPSASAGADQRGGVHVVAAGVRDAGDGAAPTGRRSGRGTGSASRSARSATTGALGADLGDQAAALEPGDPPAGLAVRARRRPRRWCGARPSDSSGWACRSRRSVDQVVGVLVDDLLDRDATEVAARGDISQTLVQPRGHDTGVSGSVGSAGLPAGVVGREDPVGGHGAPAARRPAPPRVRRRGPPPRRRDAAAAGRARRGPAPR